MGMIREMQIRALVEKVVQSLLSTLPRRPLPASAHQAAAELYEAIDRYVGAASLNQTQGCRNAAESLAVEALRVLMGYELPSAPAGVDRVRVESVDASKELKAR